MATSLPWRTHSTWTNTGCMGQVFDLLIIQSAIIGPSKVQALLFAVAAGTNTCIPCYSFVDTFYPELLISMMFDLSLRSSRVQIYANSQRM